MDLERKTLVKIGAGAMILLIALVVFIVKETLAADNITVTNASGIPPATGTGENPGEDPGAASSSTDAALMNDAPSRSEIIVDVSGAVKNPGIARLEEGSRVIDAVEQAGGLTPDADTDYINLAAFIQDGEKIYVPKKGELTGQSDQNSPLAAAAGAGQGNSSVYTVPSAGNSANPAVSQNGKVNLNTANAQQLQTLNGIGPAIAEKILHYRQQNGGFKKIEDIMNVSGIGQKTFDKFKDRICI